MAVGSVVVGTGGGEGDGVGFCGGAAGGVSSLRRRLAKSGIRENTIGGETCWNGNGAIADFEAMFAQRWNVRK